MNKYLYKNINCLYNISVGIRMPYYFLLGKREKARKIITEHMDW